MPTLAEILVTSAIIGGVGAAGAGLMADLENQVAKLTWSAEVETAADCATLQLSGLNLNQADSIQAAVKNPNGPEAAVLLACYANVVGDDLTLEHAIANLKEQSR